MSANRFGRLRRAAVASGLVAAIGMGWSGCGGGAASPDGGSRAGDGATPGSDGATHPGSDGAIAAVDGSAPPAGPNGNPNGHCAVPAAAQPEDTSHPTTVVGSGTPASCTADAVVAAIHAGGVVTFDCGPDPVTIVVPEISIFNDGGKGDGSVTLDGGGKVTLSGGGQGRILYQNTCDQALHWTTSHCQAQDTPHLVLQHIAFVDGRGDADATRGLLGGGAIYVGGGTFKAYDIRVSSSTQPTLGPDNAGGAIYTFNQTAPVYVVASTFDGDTGSNGGALGSIGTSWTILDSLFSGDHAVGSGENPPRAGTPGGGLGGAIYNDGNGYTLTICGSAFEGGQANELGSGSIFQVVDDLRGALAIDQSTFTGNSVAGGVQGSSHPSIYVEAMDKQGVAGVTITNTTFQ